MTQPITERGGQEDVVVTSPGRFTGRFSRGETYPLESLPRENFPGILAENRADFTAIDGITPINPFD